MGCAVVHGSKIQKLSLLPKLIPCNQQGKHALTNAPHFLMRMRSSGLCHHFRPVIPANFFHQTIQWVKRAFEKIRRLFVWFCRNSYVCAAKKSFNVSFFMEEGMACEKQKLTGTTDFR
ncbi:MAG: hypothetical protein OXC66_10530, partial [Roseovarius sp.]|nr:hypothetical protein [Roseovarius sp.]